MVHQHILIKIHPVVFFLCLATFLTMVVATIAQVSFRDLRCFKRKKGTSKYFNYLPDLVIDTHSAGKLYVVMATMFDCSHR